MFHKLFVDLGVFLVVTALAAPVAADTFTFDVTSGEWKTGGNWTPEGGPPGIDDKAIIPNGKTCQIASADSEEAEEVELTGTGVLDVDGTLTIGENAASEVTVLTVNSSADFDGSGELHLYSNASINADVTLGEVTIYNDLTLTGTGIVRGEADWTSDGDEDVTIDTDLTLVNVGRQDLDMINNGTIQVSGNGSNVSFLQDVSGSGLYLSTNSGNLIVDPGGVLKGTDGTWRVTGGLFDYRGSTDTCFSDTLDFQYGTVRIGTTETPTTDFSHCGEFNFGGNTQVDLVVEVKDEYSFEVGLACGGGC